MKKLFIQLLFLISIVLYSQKQIDISLNKTLFEVQPTMWGIFFEDINFAGDGGIYAELVKNRSFEFYKPMMGWNFERREGRSGRHYIINRDEYSKNPRFIRIVNDKDDIAFGITNIGFRDMGIKKGIEYKFSVLARKFGGNLPVLKIELTDDEGNILGEASINGIKDDWGKYKATFVAANDCKNAILKVLLEGKGTLDLDMISLFPGDTWKNRENGMRADLMQLLYDMQPGFVRFPGGCIVEGYDLRLRYQWKKTIGPVEDREMLINRWNTEMRRRQTPDYYQSFGLGFYEYFLISEDLNAEPLPIINCGMACQYNSQELVPMGQLDPYIQDALDLIEFANGPVTSKWGKVRADMGHPDPFNLKYIGIGNEQWGEQYVERYNVFAEKIRERYPEIKLVSGSGPRPDDERYKYLWSKLPDMDVNLVDEHFYMNPEWFQSNAKRYDSYDRSWPKVFAGEYAAHGPDNEYASSRNTWLSALSEAAFLTGLERNADMVYMTSYAPLFGHVDAWQWRPDLIWFDNLKAFGSPNYHVQKLYSNHSGTHVVPVTLNNEPITGQDSLYASSTIDKVKKEAYIKLVNTSSKQQDITLNIKSLEGNKITVFEMSSDELLIYNSIEEPEKIVPKEKEITASDKLNYTLPPYSFSLFKMNIK